MPTQRNSVVYRLRTKHRPHLLFAMMRALADGDARISFEGQLFHTELVNLEGVSFDETNVLRRGTIAPKLDFLVLPLTPDGLAAIEKAVNSRISFHSTEGIVHVQIERHGKLAFAAYDNFDENCIVAYSAVPVALLDELLKRKVLHAYEAE